MSNNVTMKGGIFSIGSGVVLEKLLLFVSSIILARLLLPQDFGLATTALIITDAISLLGNAGITSALVYKNERLIEFSSAAFWLSIIIAIILCIIQAAVAPLAQSIYNSLELKNILYALCLSFIIDAFGNVHRSLALKNLRYNKITLITLFAAFFQFISVIILAWLNFGVWSIIFGKLIYQTVNSFGYWFIIPWHPDIIIKAYQIKELFSYGWNILIADGLGYISHNADYFIIGKSAGSSPLGIYTIAYNLAMLPSTTISVIASKVAFPLFSKYQYDSRKLLEILKASTLIVSVIGFPFVFGLFILSHEIILVLYGPNWINAVLPLKILLFYSIGRMVSSFGGILLNAIGKPDFTRKFNLIYTPILVLGLVISSRFGMIGIAYATALISGSATWVYFSLILRKMKWGFKNILSDILIPLSGSFVMGICVYLLNNFWRISFSSIIHLLSLVLIGAVIYASYLLIIFNKLIIARWKFIQGYV